MQHEAAAGLDGAAGMYADRLRAGPALDIELVEQIGEGELVEQLVDDKTHRAFFIVSTHEDHGAFETLVAHLRHGDQQTPGQGPGYCDLCRHSHQVWTRPG